MKLVRRLCAAAACMAVTLGAVGAALPPAAAETLPAVAADTVTAAADGYAVYAAALTDCPDAAQAITLAGGAYIQATDGLQRSADYGTAPDAVLLPQGTGTLTYELEVPQTALYTLSLRYASLEGNGLDIRVGLRIDGEYPFSEAAELSFPRMWHNESETWKQDKDGNDLTPEQTEYRDMVDQPARDSLGVEVEPYVFRLTAGRHTITVEGGGEAFALGQLCFLPPERLAAYTAPTDLTDAQGVQPIVLQGESATYKSSSAMVPKGDNTDAAMTPASAENVRLNYIGGSSWAKPNASATWSFRVEQAGYYKLAFRFKQDQIINAKTYRRLKIDGVTPFAEAACIAFPYATKWQAQVLVNAPSLAGNAFFVWKILFSGDSYGYLNSFLLNLGMITEPVTWLSDARYLMPIIVLVQLWQCMGISFLSNIAGLQNVNRDLYEAGAIDGVRNRWQELWYITLPSMQHMILFSVVMQIQSSFSVSAITTELAGYPSVGQSVDTIVSHMIDVGTVRYEMGYASAVAVVLFLLMAGTRIILGKFLQMIGR